MKEETPPVVRRRDGAPSAFLASRVGGGTFGIDLRAVRGIDRRVEILPLPVAPEEVLGRADPGSDQNPVRFFRILLISARMSL